MINANQKQNARNINSITVNLMNVVIACQVVSSASRQQFVKNAKMISTIIT